MEAVNPLHLYLLPEEVDFIVARMTSGTMDWGTAGKISQLMTKISAQANDKALQEPVKSPTPPSS